MEKKIILVDIDGTLADRRGEGQASLREGIEKEK